MITLYLDEKLLATIKMIAASSARTEGDVVDDALRVYLKGDAAKAAGTDVRAIMQRVAQGATADEATATQVALDEVAKVRRARQAD